MDHQAQIYNKCITTHVILFSPSFLKGRLLILARHNLGFQFLMNFNDDIVLNWTVNCQLIKDLFHCWQNVSNSTLYPDVLKIKTNGCETKFYKNASRLLFTNFQIHHLATLLPGRPSHRVARYGFVNKKMAFLKNFVWQQSLFLFSKHLDTMLNLTHFVNSETDPWF